NDDAEEHIGRFSPMVMTNQGIDDYSAWGYFGATVPNPDPNPVPQGVQGAGNKPKWRYRFAMYAMDQFTTVSNPESDLYPNLALSSWIGKGRPPAPVPNTVGTQAQPNNPETEYVTEGLVNINSASWRTLAA